MTVIIIVIIIVIIMRIILGLQRYLGTEETRSGRGVLEIGR